MLEPPLPTLVLWVDDERVPEPLPECPDARIVHAHTCNEAIGWLNTLKFDWVSLDHDLGDTSKRSHKERTGYTLALYMAEHDIWPSRGVIVHSWNSVGADNIAQTVDRYGPYTKAAIRRPAFNYD